MHGLEDYSGQHSSFARGFLVVYFFVKINGVERGSYLDVFDAGFYELLFRQFDQPFAEAMLLVFLINE